MTAKTYEGSCHCGAVKYQVTMEPPKKAFTGNCSMCERAGYTLVFVPSENFRLLQGQDALTDYQFNRHHIHHLFCGTCGIKSFSTGKDSQGKETAAINLRCIPEIDARSLEIESYNCKVL